MLKSLCESRAEAQLRKREEPISQHEKAGDKGSVRDWFISARLHWGYAAPQHEEPEVALRGLNAVSICAKSGVLMARGGESADFFEEKRHRTLLGLCQSSRCPIPGQTGSCSSQALSVLDRAGYSQMGHPAV